MHHAGLLQQLWLVGSGESGSQVFFSWPTVTVRPAELATTCLFLSLAGAAYVAAAVATWGPDSGGACVQAPARGDVMHDLHGCGRWGRSLRGWPCSAAPPRGARVQSSGDAHRRLIPHPARYYAA